MSDTELVNVGLSREAHSKMVRLKESGYFNEMADAYRFAVALALAHGGATTDFTERQNFLNVGSLDRDGSLHTAVALLRQPSTENVYRTVERLATWGIEELDRRSQHGTLSFTEILNEIDELSQRQTV
jgi:Arc/MetJ-type ribon-helix-helix transcriptional regulator